MNRINEPVGLGQMLEDIGTDHQIELAERGDIVLVQIDLAEGGIGDLRKQEISLVGKSYGTTMPGQLGAENAMTTAEVQNARFRIKAHAGLFDPPHGIVGLELVKEGIVFVLEMVGD